MTLSNEAEYVLKAVEERGIRFIRLWFTDVLGFLKSFAITAQELEGALSEGQGFDGSSIEGFSRIQESDMVAIPDPSTFQVIPWRSEAEVARMFCDIYEPEGSPFDGDPRFVRSTPGTVDWFSCPASTEPPSCKSLSANPSSLL